MARVRINTDQAGEVMSAIGALDIMSKITMISGVLLSIIIVDGIKLILNRLNLNLVIGWQIYLVIAILTLVGIGYAQDSLGASMLPYVQWGVIGLSVAGIARKILSLINKSKTAKETVNPETGKTLEGFHNELSDYFSSQPDLFEERANISGIIKYALLGILGVVIYLYATQSSIFLNNLANGSLVGPLLFQVIGGAITLYSALMLRLSGKSTYNIQTDTKIGDIKHYKFNLDHHSIDEIVEMYLTSNLAQLATIPEETQDSMARPLQLYTAHDPKAKIFYSQMMLYKDGLPTAITDVTVRSGKDYENNYENLIELQ